MLLSARRTKQLMKHQAFSVSHTSHRTASSSPESSMRTTEQRSLQTKGDQTRCSRVEEIDRTERNLLFDDTPFPVYFSILFCSVQFCPFSRMVFPSVFVSMGSYKWHDYVTISKLTEMIICWEELRYFTTRMSTSLDP